MSKNLYCCTFCGANNKTNSIFDKHVIVNHEVKYCEYACELIDDSNIKDFHNGWLIESLVCEGCGDLILLKSFGKCHHIITSYEYENKIIYQTLKWEMVNVLSGPEKIYPKFNYDGDFAFKLRESELPDVFAELYKEASINLDISPRASAVLIRMLLEGILIEVYNIDPKLFLAPALEKLKVKGENLPNIFHDCFDNIKEVGNYAIHYKRYLQLEVGRDEAERSLNIIKEWFEYIMSEKKLRNGIDKWNEKKS